MSLIDSIKAALAQAAAQDAKPFRLELQPDQIEALKAAGVVETPPERWRTALGALDFVPIYRALEGSELLAPPPAPELRALHIPI
jgi:hypothetical protein